MTPSISAARAIRCVAVLVTVLATVMVSAGCGSSAPPVVGTLTVRGGERGGEMYFDPDTVTVEAGRQHVIFRNVGVVGHELTFLDSSRSSIGGISAGPGGTSEFDVDLEPGTYRMICREMGHAPAGMVGVLTVEASG